MTQLPSRLFGHSVAAKHLLPPMLDDDTFTVLILVLESSKLIRTSSYHLEVDLLHSPLKHPITHLVFVKEAYLAYQFITKNDNNNSIIRVYTVSQLLKHLI